MAYGFMIESKIAATDVGSYNRSAVCAAADVAGGGLVSVTAPAKQGEDRYTAELPKTGGLTDLWMAYNPSYQVVTVNGKSFAGLSIDPRDFTNAKGKTFSIFKPVKYDNIVLSADAVAGDSIAVGDVLEGANGTATLTKVISHTAGNTAFKVSWIGTLPFPQAGIGNEFYKAYMLECIEA